MVYTLENDKLKIAVSDHGGELQSLYEKEEKREYLWQGDPTIWKGQAPNLFPYIARLTEGKYTFQGKEYHMEIHGIVKYKVLKGCKNKDELVFELEAEEDTRKSYPFEFVYRIYYRLEGGALHITYEVENRDSKNMYFGLGGHPGFQVPFVSGTEFEDYYLEFKQGMDPVRVTFSEDCFVTGEKSFDLLKENRLPLSHDLFDEDAIVLREMGDTVTLKTDKSAKSINVSFPQMTYLGLWHMPHTKAPYVCIEPWTSLPSRKGIVEALEKQDNLICLNPKQKYQNTWTIEIK